MQAYRRARFNAQTGSLRGCLIQPLFCFYMHYLEMYHCRQAVGFYSITQKESKAQWDWSTKLLRWDLPSACVRGRVEYKDWRLAREVAAQGIRFAEVSNPIWPRKSGAAAALIMAVMIKAKFSSSCLHHLPLLGQQQKAGKEKGTYPVVLDEEAAGVPVTKLRSHQHGIQTFSSTPYRDTNWLMSIYLIVLLRSN